MHADTPSHQSAQNSTIICFTAHSWPFFLLQWRDHWMQGIYFMRKPLQVQKGRNSFTRTWFCFYVGRHLYNFSGLFQENACPFERHMMTSRFGLTFIQKISKLKGPTSIRKPRQYNIYTPTAMAWYWCHQLYKTFSLTHDSATLKCECPHLCIFPFPKTPSI